MGLYIDNSFGAHLKIKEIGEPVSTVDITIHKPGMGGRYAVAVLHNSESFVALAVLYNQEEVYRFVRGRPDAIYYMLTKDQIMMLDSVTGRALK